ncbi:hypothetical protein NPIL_107821 [Nephila pilipes]|uniref:Uncharacterized protein n=1 Tax=Nephila pilipes TaxID=299642 RepID=A0A8X6QUY8_NEPPI|nr:hypothetical protein NPIL_107821 [Nephila pilipes]
MDVSRPDIPKLGKYHLQRFEDVVDKCSRMSRKGLPNSNSGAGESFKIFLLVGMDTQQSFGKSICPPFSDMTSIRVLISIDC